MKRLFLLSVLSVALAACADKDPDIHEFTAPSIEDVYATGGADHSQVVIVCRVSSGESIKEYGVFFGEGEMRKIPASNLRDNAFSVTVGGLSYSREYQYKAYIDGGRGAVYSDIKTWKTDDEIPPVTKIIKTVRGLGADAGKVTLSCFIDELAKTEGVGALRCGVCYSPSRGQPTVDDSRKEAAGFSDGGDYTVDIEGLVKSTAYHFRPYAMIGEKVTYGEAVSVKIPSGADVVVTEGYSELTHHSVVLEGVLNEELAPGETAVCGFELNGSAMLSEEPDASGRFSLTLNDLAPGTDYGFRAVALVGEIKYYGKSLAFKTPEIPGADVGYVDLGLSVLWAESNLGANSAVEPGNAYAWGETETKANYTWENYKWCMGTKESISKYTLPSYTSQADNKAVLDPEDDAAREVLGGKWRMPTAAECQELLDNCEVVRTTVGEADGFLVTSKLPGYEDRSIFLLYIDYWTSELCSGYTPCAQKLKYNWSLDILTLQVWNITESMAQVEIVLSFNSEYLWRRFPAYIRPVRER